MTDNFSNRALPPLTYLADDIDIDDCDALVPDNYLDGDTSISDYSRDNNSNDMDNGGGGKFRARPAKFPSAQP